MYFQTPWGILLSRCWPSQAHRRARIVIVWAAVTLLQGCVFELAELNNASFGAQPDIRSANGRAQPTGERPASSTRAAPKTKSGLQSAQDTYMAERGSPVARLSGETDQLLAQYGYTDTDVAASAPSSAYGAGNAITPSVLPLTAEAYLAKTFSIDVVNAPLDTVLFSLAVDAGLELVVKGELGGGVTASIVSKPFEQILSLLAEQADFHWQLHNDRLTVRDGSAYGITYSINYLNMQRHTQSSVGLATRVGTINASDDSGSSIANSSQTRIENTSEHRFWESVQSDIERIVRQSHVAADTVESDVAINREAGLLTLFATPDVHRALTRYLKLLHASSQRQVLIEATVVEVALSTEFEAGVDWQLIASGISGVNAAQMLVGAPTVLADTVDRLTAPSGLVSIVQNGGGGDVKATLSLLEQFGDVRILSRPRIIAMNNQSSVLKVVDNRVYFTVNVQRRQTEEKDEITTETQIHTVPVGLLMNVTPQISQSGVVMLNVRPTLSRILGFVNDPNPELALANVRNGVPEIQVREMESMLQVKSGDVAIIGGLMQQTQADNDARIPVLGRLPWLGKLFSKQSREGRQTELLIVLRPTVLDTFSGYTP